MSYAIIKTGGKQYRVEEGQTLLVERLRGDVGDPVDVQTLLSVGEGGPADGGAVRAEVVAHERGPKLRVVKFKPKRGYKRRTGHRQDLTRIRITSLGAS
jgi:large subunit ribosomal protein L21